MHADEMNLNTYWKKNNWILNDYKIGTFRIVFISIAPKISILMIPR